ncbi:Gfo/Idh/MocA family oxidoreductase [Micromonospora olivasterospora]|uniref:Myo-inositol 2-dehydrogenase/D-chiro-inositol 1-dehydrogenase n=1 Tax=Micromonospora olivasterospora TaxID=1880 RepID=Q2MFZ7_MICOL|nr:Gfo/Idh/MocA family oxidoreductase [Micromonospora olivasterospora]TWH67108.1 myo-inositol 2-dehydrogenase/D-chiro-inositol 1-dehydrogenase [Micromonospora olivasterospora]CAF31550.1 putative myo-inositol 3-dehydrogenase [Micromonospora olivasterospora]
MRVGLIGAGRIGAVHAQSLAGDPRVRRVDVVDADPDRGRRVAEAVGGHVADSVDALLDDAPDAVVVATPTHTHADLVVRFAARGIPVLCEKPVFADLATARRVAAQVREIGTPVQVAFQRRFDPGYLRGYEAVRSGAVGQLRRMHLVTADPEPPPAAYVAVSGGIHRDCQIHDFDVLRWISGREVVEVYATGANRGAGYIGAAGDADEAVAVLTLDDGTLATMQASRYNGAGYDVRMELAGSSATLAVGLDTRVPLRSVEPDAPPFAAAAWSGFLDRFAAAYRAEVAAFLGLVAASTAGSSTGLFGHCTVDDALQALLIAEAAATSRRERRPVLLAEVGNEIAPVVPVGTAAA